MGQSIAVKTAQNQAAPRRKAEQLELDLFGSDNMPEAHLRALTGGLKNQSTIIWTPASGSKQWHTLKGTDFDAMCAEINKFHGQHDVYISVNEFHNWRRISLGSNLNGFFVDIDCRGEDADPDFTARRALYLIEEELNWPLPNLAVMSGRGVHFYWLFDRPLPFTALPRWQHCQRNIVASLNGDRRAVDATRVLRLVGSVNSKSNTMVTASVVGRSRYDFEYLFELFSDNAYFSARWDARHGERQPGPITDIRKAAADRGRKPAAGSIYSRWYLVYQDLRTIVRMGFNGVVSDGTRARDTFLYHFANALSWFTLSDALEDEVLEIARQIVPSFTRDEVLKYTQSVRERAEHDAHMLAENPDFDCKSAKSRYRYKRETLWTELREFISDDMIPHLRAIVPASVIRERKNERDRLAYASAAQTEVRPYGRKNDAKRAQALIFHTDGMSVRAIAEKLNVSPNTVSLWLKSMLARVS